MNFLVDVCFFKYGMHCSCSDFPNGCMFQHKVFQFKTVRLCRLRHLLAFFMELVGKEVEVSGLFTRADLNGKRGFVEAFYEDKGRCAVKFGSGASVLVKNTNLKKLSATHPSAAKDTKIEALERAAATALEKAKVLRLRGADVSLEALRCKYLCPL